MPPIVAAIGAAVGAVVEAVGSIISAVALFSIGSIPVGRILLSVGLNLVLGQLFAPKKARVSARQAQTLELTIGETPREAVFGRTATGGVLLNAWNDGSENEFETFVIKWADHEIDGVEGFLLDDKYYALTTQGAQTHADFQDGGARLWIEWRLGAPGQTVCPIITTNGVAAGEWTALEAANSFKGFAYVCVRYKISDKVWKSGRPGQKFKWILRGLKTYDPRLDSTVEGGSGPHRWGQPSTYTFSRLARRNHYNFVRGVWNYAADPPQLMVGPGKSADEAPPEDAIAAINLCDEDVALRAGGTEKRYLADGVVRADETWIDVEEHFAAAMGGQLVERGGGINVDPGAAKEIEFTFTDKKLLSGQDMSYQAETTGDERVNTVIARYVDTNALWQEGTAPMRRSAEDIAADGKAREKTIDLVFVTSPTQAQRCAEIERRKARLMPAAVVPLGPAYMLIEDGDWGEWTSDRRFGGDTRTFEVQGVVNEESGDNKLALKEISASVFTWNPATDELAVDRPAYLPPGAPADAFVADFDAEPLEITSAEGISAGAIRATWTPPNDVTIVGIRLEYRPKGGAASTSIVVDPRTGEYVISVLPVTDVDYEIRATPVTSPTRDGLTTAWRDVLLGAPFTTPQPPLNFVGYQNGDLIRFLWQPYADTTLQYEIRCGETFDLGRFVFKGYGGATAIPWPIASEDDDLLFWIKTVHRSGVYSETASLWVATPNDLTGRNFVLAEDFQAEMFPGVRHDLHDAYVGDVNVLELDGAGGGITKTRGDYYTSIALLDTFSARTWLEHRASAYINDTPPWEGGDDDGESWEDDDDDWLPDIGDAGGDATLDGFIALNTALPDGLIEAFAFDGATTGARGTLPGAATGITYAPAKARSGAVVAGALAYEVELGAQFSKLVDVRLSGEAPDEDKTLFELSNGAGAFLRVIWRAQDQRWVLEGDFGAEVALALPWTDDDTVSIGIWQSDTARGAMIASRMHAEPFVGSALLQ